MEMKNKKLNIVLLKEFLIENKEKDILKNEVLKEKTFNDFFIKYSKNCDSLKNYYKCFNRDRLVKNLSNESLTLLKELEVFFRSKVKRNSNLSILDKRI